MSIKNISNKELMSSLISIIYEEMSSGRIDVATISGRLSLSPSQLNRRVKAMTGMTVSTFAMDLRIYEAKQLLSHSPEHTITDVAYACGFSDLSHFTKSFRNHTGMTPTEYVHSTAKDDEDFELFIRAEIKKASRDKRDKNC